MSIIEKIKKMFTIDCDCSKDEKCACENPKEEKKEEKE